MIRGEHQRKVTGEETELEELIKQYGAFVRGLALKMHKSLKLRIDVEDLIAYGHIGLIEAWRRFDHSSRASFTSFAFYRVRGAMYDGCRAEGWIPRDRSKEVRAQRRLDTYLSGHHDANQDAPAPRTFADALARVEQTVSSAVTVLLLEDAELDNLLGEQTPDALTQLEQKDMKRVLYEAIKQLDEHEQRVIMGHHMRDVSLTDLAQELGFSVSWVSRIHSRAIDKLRDYMLRSQ